MAARRLVALLERERKTKWMVLPSVVMKWELREAWDLRAVVVRIHDRDLLPRSIEAWRLDDPEALEAEIRPSLLDAPRDAKILAIWSDVARRSTCVLLSHPSFEVVRDGDEPPYWIPLRDACMSCGSRLVFSARMRGEGLCGPCSSLEQLRRERRQADEIAAQIKAETGVDVDLDVPRRTQSPMIQMEVEELTPERIAAIFPPRPSDPPPAA